MTDPRLDFLDRLEAATKERMQRVQVVAEQVGALSAEATSPDRLVTVKVGPNGALLDLVLDDDAMDLDARALAALVLATARTAAERAATAMNDAVAPLEAPLDVSAPGASKGVDAAAAPPTAQDDAIARAERAVEAVDDRLRGLGAGPS